MISLVFVYSFFFISLAAFFPYLQILLRNNGFSYSAVGLILAVGDAAAIFIPLILSRVADKTRKKRLLILFSGFVSILAFMPLAFSQKILIAIIFIFICRSFNSSIIPLLDSVSISYLQGNSSKYSIVRTMGTVGFIFFGIIAGVFGFARSDSNKSIAMIYGCTAGIFFILCFFLPRTFDSNRNDERIIEHDQIDSSENSSWLVFDKRSSKRSFLYFMVAVFFIKFSNSAIDRLLSSYIVEILGLESRFILFIALGAASEIVVFLIAGNLRQEKGVQPWVFLIIGATALSIRLLICSLTSSIIIFALTQCLQGLTYGIFHIGAISYISGLVPPKNTSQALGIYNGFGISLPGMAGSMLGGQIIQNYGYNSLFATYGYVAVLGVAVLLIFRRNLLIFQHKSV